MFGVLGIYNFGKGIEVWSLLLSYFCFAKLGELIILVLSMPLSDPYLTKSLLGEKKLSVMSRKIIVMQRAPESIPVTMQR